MKVLIVDDDPLNLELLQEYLELEGFAVTSAEGGQQALDALERSSDFSLILLDRMMPSPDGMEVMEKVREHPEWRLIPVIMQTAAGQEEQIEQGIEAGVFYYLIKPFSRTLLLSIVHSALKDSSVRARLQERLAEQRRVPALLQRATYRFRTLEEAGSVASFVSRSFPNPNEVVFGLNELLVNAVEHGNLEISYEEKRELMIQNRWNEEVAKRLRDPLFFDRYAELTMYRDEDLIRLECRDMGSGFDPSGFLEIDPSRTHDPNGRGIAMARRMGFNGLSFSAKGNEWKCSWGSWGAQQQSSTAERTVLLLDHNRSDLIDLSETIISQGLNLVCASTGKEAIHWCYERRPDLVILELSLPDMSGLEVIRFLRSTLRLKEVPLIVFTHEDCSNYSSLFDRYGGVFTLSKSSSKEHLVETIKQSVLVVQ